MVKKNLALTFLFAFFVVQSNACYIIFLSDDKHVLIGNHEDWYAKDGGIKVLPPTSKRYGSVIFTFMSEGWAQGGMNEHGLFFDAARTPDAEVQFSSQSKPFNGYIWQAVLDRCKTLDEALAFIQNYQLPELADVSVVLADATGDAVVVGVKDGKLGIEKFKSTYLCQTNFNRWHKELSEESTCWRYEKTQAEMGKNPEVSFSHLKQLLEGTHQDALTIYTNIYDLKERKIYTYNKRNFQAAITVQVPDIFKLGECIYSLDSLERHPDYWNTCKPSRSYVIKGKVIDQDSKQPVPYANIGLIGQNVGTLSDADGTFELALPESLKDSVIHFSSIGYDKYTSTLAALPRGESGHVIRLKQNTTILKEVVVRSTKQRFKIDRLGWMGGRDGVLPLDTVQGGGAVALLIQAPKSPIFVEKLQVRLMYNSKDTLTYRLHFYEYDSVNQIPGRELLDKEILLKETKRFGWLRFNLERYEIAINSKKFFVAFEWIDDRKTRNAMVAGLREWEKWKKKQCESGNSSVEVIKEGEAVRYKYHGNMMNWPGFKSLPPFTGLMVETGKHGKTEALRTFERKTSFGKWVELSSTLNAVLTVEY